MRNYSQELYDAIVANNLPAARNALHNRADINLRIEDTQESLLHIAAKAGNANVVIFLLENGINPFIQDNKDKKAAAVATPETQSIIKEWENALRELYDCAQNGKATELKTLLQQDIPKKIVAYNICDILQSAANNGHKDVVELLLQHGANPSISNQAGKKAADVASRPEISGLIKQYETAINALYYWAQNGKATELKTLLQQDIPKKIVASNKWDILNMAAEHGQKDVVELLLQHGADINAKFGLYKFSALHFAVVRNKQDVVELLCAYGANPFITDGDGDTPLYYCKNEDIKNILESYQSTYTCRKCGGALLAPLAPAILCYALSSNPIYPAVLSGAMLTVSRIFLTGLNARDINAIAGYSAATALFMFADSVSSEYVLPCKLIAGSIAIATACYAQSPYINSGEEPQLGS